MSLAKDGIDRKYFDVVLKILIRTSVGIHISIQEITAITIHRICPRGRTKEFRPQRMTLTTNRLVIIVVSFRAG